MLSNWPSLRAWLHRLAALLLALGLAPACAATPDPDTRVRLIVLTDIGNEPDDAESFVRLLVYSNEFDIEGLVATTSVWQQNKVQPQLLRERIDAYGKVFGNLRRHAEDFPDAASLHAAVRSGSSLYGMAGVGDGRETEASRLIIEAVDRGDPRPVYVSIWGGAADLAQALWTVRATRTPGEVAAFVARIRVYSISDQDDAGPWLRANFPALSWIFSDHAFSHYDHATWQGISDDLRQTEKWPGSDMVTNAWIEANIRLGPLGALYPPHIYMMEGDTPAFLGLVPNGLNVPERIDWGGWGGRYLPPDDGAAHYANAYDHFTDDTGKLWVTNKASIFRWRTAFQNDFAARIAWTLDAAAANHAPLPVLNGEGGLAPVHLSVRSGERVTLTADGSADPDGDALAFRWRPYPELTPPGAPPLNFPASRAASLQFTAPEVLEATLYHILLELTDTGTPNLTTYRRAILTVTP